MADYSEVEEDNIPMSIKSELYRLSSLLDLDENDVQSERDCVQLLARAIRSIERIKSEGKQNSGRNTDSATGHGASRQENKIAAKAKSLEDDLRISLKTFDDVTSLKAKITQLQGQVRKEKEQRIVFEKFIESQNKKIMILISHVDKLMKALKRESGKTIKALESNRIQEKEMFGLNQKVEKQAKVIAIQNRYVAEIAEGSRILQDQLALMDEKYLELRNRLESSRKQFMNQMSRVTKESSELRVKYSMATHGKLLDTIPMPSQHEMNNFMNTGTTEGFRGSMDTAELLRGGTTGKKGKPRAASARAATSTSRNQFTESYDSQHGGAAQSPGGGGGTRGSFMMTRNFSGGDSWKQDPNAAGTPFKDKAQKLFVDGMMRNHQYQQSLSPAEAEAKEKQIVRKITEKQKKGDVARWNESSLQELVKGK